MAYIHGRNLLIYEGATPTAIAAAKSCSIDLQCDTKEVSSPSTGTWRTYIAGRKSWTVTLSKLVLADGFKADLLRVGESVTLSMGVRDDDTDRVTGAAIIQRCQITGTVGNLVQGSFSFVGTGTLG